MATKMSKKMLELIPEITAYLKAGMSMRKAVKTAGINGCSSIYTIKNYMIMKGMLDKNGKIPSTTTGNTKPNVKTNERDHDEFDENVFRERVRSYRQLDTTYRGNKKTFVITAALNDSEVDDGFLKTLELYCLSKDAELFIVPIRYTNPTNSLSFKASKSFTWDPKIKNYVLKQEVNLGDIRILGNLNISATTSNPTNGFHDMSKGESLILAHPRLHMEVLPILNGSKPAVITTTGAVTKACYSDSKAGYRANFNHELSAIVVELDGQDFHFRQLCWDGEGFYDLNMYYTPNGATFHQNACEALFMGDAHVKFMDKDVLNATLLGSNSILNILKPRVGIWSDFLDFFSASHHHHKMPFTQYAKAKSSNDCIQSEMDQALSILGLFEEDWIQAANHNDHLKKWLETADIQHDQTNKKIYHLLNYLMYDKTEFGLSGTESPNPFQLYAEMVLDEAVLNRVKFLTRSQSYKIFDIEVGCHGDIGANGSRGSRLQYSKFPDKTIIGHSHTPGINGGCWQVGTSSMLRLEYNVGPSNWLNTHCVIYRNGERQLINIINGKWRREN